jgi:hypothetical protein
MKTLSLLWKEIWTILSRELKRQSQNVMKIKPTHKMETPIKMKTKKQVMETSQMTAKTLMKTKMLMQI